MSDDNAPAFTVTRAELIGIVRAAVRQELSARALLVDKQLLAQQLDCSSAHIDHLRKRGLPVVKVGQSVRFETDKVLEWLRTQSSQNDSE
jgi:hypothetical protein